MDRGVNANWLHLSSDNGKYIIFRNIFLKSIVQVDEANDVTFRSLIRKIVQLDTNYFNELQGKSSCFYDNGDVFGNIMSVNQEVGVNYI